MNNAALVILMAFFDICLFRKRPQDLPASPAFLFMCLLIYTLTSFVLALLSQNTLYAAVAGVIETILIMLVTYFFLKLKNVQQRWMQATTALSGTGIIFSLLAIPLFFWMASSGDAQSVHVLLYLLVVALVLWNIAVMAHVMRHSLSVSFTAGVCIALVYIWLIASAVNVISPQQAA